MRGLSLDDAPKPRGRLRMLSALIALSIVGGFLLSPHFQSVDRTAARDFHSLPISCPAQHSALAPTIPFLSTSKEEVYGRRLQGAVQLRTETFDGAPHEGDDSWYDKFYALESYLLENFPDVDESLAPIVLMAHQDTVPVPEETVERWTHPPFAGHIDTEGWVWGCGVVDSKNTLIATFSAVSELIASGFSPQRTVLLASGFDEEGGDVRSARVIAQKVEDRYVLDSIFAIVDEGGGVIADHFGQTWVAPATMSSHSHFSDDSIQANPPHTAIGILSTLVAAVEAHSPPVTLSPGNPFSPFVICLGKYGTIDEDLKQALLNERTWPAAAEMLAEQSPGYAARLTTTQAVDIVRGGVKVDALPEEAHAIVNHRVATDDSISRVRERYIELLAPEAAEFNLSVVGFGEEPIAGLTRYLRLSSPGGAEASPVSPTAGDAWRVFSGTSLYLWPDAIVTPYLSTGGTDTRA
ncbi:hypothetical protein DFH08DRAFT_974663 [Mycena albidolilacea]|uniref:Peptidase M20 dimerisation domain-containing protein n=1 Tax=Mycena albidolilacea TaxID=1033008 RepID=A0AAD7EC46_9AGAR|nr:hypothetical protein DFH08DRAFT_974663 [Mycena albidolilacea]